MENSKVSLQNVNLYYGDFHALKNLNLEIPANQVTAFIGPSGCGKSTCIQIPEPYERPDRRLQNHRHHQNRRGGYLRPLHRRDPCCGSGRAWCSKRPIRSL